MSDSFSLVEISEKLSSLKIKRKALITGIVIVVAATFFLFSPYGIIKSIKLANQRADSYNELLQMKKTNDSLREKIIEIRTDTVEIERIAREKYGMIKRGEKVYIRKKVVTENEE
ncbi:MAG: septum formation initiator family protein [bacterium]